MRVRTAKIEDRDELIDLTFRSKAYWGYDAAFMESVREELKVPVKHIEVGYVHILEDAGSLIGFFSLIEVKGEWELDFAFINPPFIGKGYGRALWEAIMEQARNQGIASFAIVADPHAEGFYLRMGAKRVGQIASSSIKNRVLPVLRAAVSERTPEQVTSGLPDAKELRVYEVLERLHIPFERFKHDPAMTMADYDTLDAGKNAAHCKNLFLTNRQGTHFYLMLVVGDKPFQSSRISRSLGVSRLSFGSPEQLKQTLGLTPGSVTPMGLINDLGHKVHVLLDRDVASWERIIVHPNVNTASILLKTEDLLRFLAHCGNLVTYVDVETADMDAEE